MATRLLTAAHYDFCFSTQQFGQYAAYTVDTLELLSAVTGLLPEAGSKVVKCLPNHKCNPIPKVGEGGRYCTARTAF